MNEKELKEARDTLIWLQESREQLKTQQSYLEMINKSPKDVFQVLVTLKDGDHYTRPITKYFNIPKSVIQQQCIYECDAIARAIRMKGFTP